MRKNVDELYNDLKKEFDEQLFRLRVKAFIGLIIQRVSIFSVCEHLFNCTRNCDSKKSYCSTCSTVKVLRSDNLKIFEDIIIDERDFTKSFQYFFGKKSLFSLGLFDNYLFWFCKGYRCLRFEEQKKPRNFCVYFLSVLLRIYINTFLKIDLRKEFNMHSEQTETYRKHVFESAYCLMFSFYLNNKFDSFNKIFEFFSPDIGYNCRCFKILNCPYISFLELKENYITKRCRDKGFNIESFNQIWRSGGEKLKEYRIVIVTD